PQEGLAAADVDVSQAGWQPREHLGPDLVLHVVLPDVAHGAAGVAIERHGDDGVVRLGNHARTPASLFERRVRRCGRLDSITVPGGRSANRGPGAGWNHPSARHARTPGACSTGFRSPSGFVPSANLRWGESIDPPRNEL